MKTQKKQKSILKKNTTNRVPALLSVFGASLFLLVFSILWRERTYSSLSGPIQQIELYPEADAFVREDQPERNFGSENQLIVDNNPTNLAYLKYNLTALPQTQNITIEKAILKLKIVDNRQNGKIVARKISGNSNWEEGSITFKDRPRDFTDRYESTESNGFIQFDVTSLLRKDRGAVTSLVIRNTTNGRSLFSSKEGNTKPVLIVTYRLPPIETTPTIITPSPLRTPTPRTTVVATNTPRPTTFLTNTPRPSVTSFPTGMVNPTPTPISTLPNPNITVYGYGKNTIGGTGGIVTVATNLTTLKTCISGTAKRICKLSGSGVWDGLGQSINIANPYITIDGEGSAVVFKDLWFQVHASEVILRHLRVRTGDLHVDAQSADAISINARSGTLKNIVVDHVEAIWGPDVSFTILNNVTDITVQNSIIGWGLSKSKHPESLDDLDGHNLAFNISGLTSSTWPKRVTIYKNIIGGAQGRYTRAMGAEAVDIINNVYYNYDEGPQGNPRSLNFVGNILRWGPAPRMAGLGDPQTCIFCPAVSSDYPTTFQGSVFEENNVSDGFLGTRGGPSSVYRTIPLVPMSLAPESTDGLLNRILTTVGPKPLDATTERWLTEVNTKTGTYFNGLGFPSPNPSW